jgi:4-amino-4-deoxy-L-arabinose transferase-like glycosyltransferase
MAGSAAQAEDSARSALVDPVAPEVEPEVEPEVLPEPAPWDPPEPTPPRTRRRRLASMLAGSPGVALLAVIVGVAAAAFASQHDLMMLYADARSHLTIARRLIDGPNHGIVQLGTVWLPVPHIVMIPFVASRWLWHTGLAAIPVDIACLVVEALAIFSLVRTITRVRWAAWIAVALLLTNPSILYLHTTALTEPVLFAALLGTTAMLAKWIANAKPWSGGEIAVYCGLPAAVAVLSRYDGWAFVAAAGLFVLVGAQARWHQWRYSLHITRCFVTPPVIAAVWWMWFNWVNFGDPLEFQRGRYSAQAQQQFLARRGLLPDMHDLPSSLHTYASSMWQGAGWLLLGAALVGMVLWAWRGHRSLPGLTPWLLVGVPFGFYVLSLWTGQAVIRLDNANGQGMFNLRYGVEMVPGLAVFVALGAFVLAGRPRTQLGREWRVLVGLAAIALVGVQAAMWWPDWRSIPVVEEGVSQRAAGAGQYAAAEWMARHAREGRIAIDDSVNPNLPVIDADLDRVAAPFSGPRWTRTLRDLTRAEWLYVDTANPQDQIARAIRRDPDFDDDFVLRHEVGNARVYQRRATP